MNRVRKAGVSVLAACLLAAPAWAAQEEPQPLPEQMKVMIQGAMDAALAEMLAPGPQQADWSKGGTDIEAAIAARPGGPAGNYLLMVDKKGDRSVQIYTSAPAATLIPANWKRVSRIGDVDGEAEGSTLGIGHLEGRYYVVSRMGERRVGSATCSSTLAGADLYEAPAEDGDKKGEPGMPPEVVEIVFRGAVEGLAKETLCSRLDAEGSGYRLRYFREDGRTLPKMDEQDERAHIIPAAPVAELLKAE